MLKQALDRISGRTQPPRREFDPRRSCVATVLDDRFLEYFLVLLFSIQKHNPGFAEEVVVFHNSRFSPLSDQSRKQIRRVYPRVRFSQVDETPYRRFFPVTPKNLHPSLFKMEVFNMREMDRVVCLDVDMLCLGDLTALLTLDVPFAAGPGGKNGEQKALLADTWHRTSFNCGMMVIGRRHLDGRTYRKLLASPLVPCPTAEQVLINRLFRWKRIYCLDHRYNYHAQFFWKGNDTDDRTVKVLHFAGGKPLEMPHEPRMRIWLEYRQEMRNVLGM